MLLEVNGETVDLPWKKTCEEAVAQGFFVYFKKRSRD